MEYQIEQYDEQQQQQQPAEQYLDEYGNEYNEGNGYVEAYEQQQQQQWEDNGQSVDQQQQYYDPHQQQQQHATDEYGQDQYEGQYDEYGAGEEEQWMDEQQDMQTEQQHMPHQDEHMYEDERQQQGQEHEYGHDEQQQQQQHDEQQGSEYQEQTEEEEFDHSPSHLHPLHSVQESDNEPISPEMNASALPSDVTLSSTLANIHADRRPQQLQPQSNSPQSAASSLQSPGTPHLMPLSPSSASKQRYVECVELLLAYCQQSTSTDDTYQAAVKLIDGLRYRYMAFAASSSANAISVSTAANATELVAALLQFTQAALAPVQLHSLLQHASRQVVEHLSLALSSVGCVALNSPSSQVSLAPSLLHSRITALRRAFRLRSYTQPLLYVSPHHAADIEELSFALSLPASSFFVVPTMPHPHSPSAVSSIYTMDVKHLHALLSRHRKEKRQSAVLLLTVGSLCSLHPSSSGYQLDDVQQLTDIADEFGLWVHAEGSQLIESGEQQRQHEYEHDSEEQSTDNASSVQAAADTRKWKERYDELLSNSAGVQTFVPSRVHSISLHANDYFTLPDTLAFTILTPNAAADQGQASHAAETYAAMSSNAASVLSLWSQLLAVSSRSFSALLALFPALLTLSHAKLDAARSALQSFNAPLLLSPADYAVLPAPPFLFFSLSLLPPYNHSYFHLTAAQANELLADNLLRRGETDAELCSLLCSPSLTPSSTLFSHTGFLYSSFTPCPAAVDSVERHTSSFHHFLDCVQAELAVIAACGALMPTLHSLLTNESDFELVPPASLSAYTRPGLCGFRFTPAAIPTSFHNEITKALLADLTSVLPAIFRGGACEAAADSTGDVVIVVEACEAVVERGVQYVVRTVHKLSKRVRLPSHVESALSAELKRSISATEAKLKAGQAGGGGVIRSIPIVGSFFSFFAGKAVSKGHSYDINTSYAAGSTQQPQQHTADKAKAGNKDDSGKPASQAGSAASSIKGTPSLGAAAAPPMATAPAQTTAVKDVRRTPVLSAAVDDQDGMFSRGSSAVPADDGNARYSHAQHAHSSGVQPIRDEQDEQPQQPEQGDEQSEQQYSDEPLSQPEAAAHAPVSEQHLFDQLSSRNAADLQAYISDGTVLTIFFPSDSTQPHEQASSSAIPLYLFFDDESASLCWCEPGQRYVVAEQTLPIAAIAELHLGNANPAFPTDAHESRCFSIVSEVIQLHCEEEDAAKRDEVVLALYSLLSNAQSQQPGEEEAGNIEQQEQEEQQHQLSTVDSQSRTAPSQQKNDPVAKQSLGEEKTADPAAPHSNKAVVSRSSAPQRHHTQSASGSPASIVSASPVLPRALELLERGSDFTVFLVDRSNSQLTSRHPVVLWYIPDSGSEGKGRLCWSRRSASAGSAPPRLEYHPSRSLLLSAAVELSLGKQTKALCNRGMEDVEAGWCVSVMVERTVLNLAADSEEARDEWLAALHAVMIHGNKKLTAL